MSANRGLILGIGHPLRQDDRAGLAVAEGLAATPPTGFDVLTHHGEGTGLIDLWQGRAQAIVVDAVASGAKAGTLHVIDAGAGPLPAALIAHSSHAFGLAQAIEMARALDRLPARFDIVGIEGAVFGHGEAMTADVEKAVHAALGLIGQELAAPVFDRGRLELVLGGEAAPIARFVALFRESAEPQIEILLQALDRGEAVERALHRLAGTAANAGALEMAGLARRMMAALPGEAPALRARLQAAWRRLAAALVEAAAPE
ncbi:MAG: hydrogenase maturation protease [Rhodospirillales bacterium]|nr:hydrogenase maturation protease [Rhodospirillales bacterium]